MKSTFRILLTAASAAALLVVMAPAAQAQCIPAQVFAGAPGANGLVARVEILGVNNAGNEIGRIWEASNSNNANNFGGNCPSSLWWLAAMASWKSPQGAFGANGCEVSSCPQGDTDEVIVLVEEYAPAGPPGIGDTAYFFAWRVDPTFAAARTWDYGRLNDGVATVNYPFLSYPDATVLSSTRSGTTVNTQMQLADVDGQVYGRRGAGQVIPDTDTVVSWDICTFHGGGDPGRLRSGWDSCTPVAYSLSGATMPFDVDCPNDAGDTYVAIGATFEGGSGGDVASELVGKATQIECDPNLADPDNGLHQRPTVRPRRGVGRSGR